MAWQELFQNVLSPKLSTNKSKGSKKALERRIFSTKNCAVSKLTEKGDTIHRQFSLLIIKSLEYYPKSRDFASITVVIIWAKFELTQTKFLTLIFRNLTSNVNLVQHAVLRHDSLLKTSALQIECHCFFILLSFVKNLRSILGSQSVPGN